MLHATLAGVILGFMMPLVKLEYFETLLHDPINFIIIPLFTLSNTAIVIPPEFHTHLLNKISMGIILGLVLGKPIGIFLFSYFSVKLKLSQLPSSINWKNIWGMGMVAGIGFTISIFISNLAFNTAILKTESIIAILFASLISGLGGFLFLYLVNKNKTSNSNELDDFEDISIDSNE